MEREDFGARCTGLREAYKLLREEERKENNRQEELASFIESSSDKVRARKQTNTMEARDKFNANSKHGT